MYSYTFYTSGIFGLEKDIQVLAVLLDVEYLDQITHVGQVLGKYTALQQYQLVFWVAIPPLQSM